MDFIDRFSALFGGARTRTRARPTAAYMRNERHALFENWYYHRENSTCDEARKDLLRYIEGFYNSRHL